MREKEIGAAAFKERCLQLLDELPPEGIVVTKHGRPVARVVPIPRSSTELIGSLKGKGRILGDLMSTGVSWEAEGE